MSWGPEKMFIRCSKGSHHPAEWTPASGEQERHNVDGHNNGVKILPFLFGLQLPLTHKPWVTLLYPYNKVGDKYFVKEVCVHLFIIVSLWYGTWEYNSSHLSFPPSTYWMHLLHMLSIHTINLWPRDFAQTKQLVGGIVAWMIDDMCVFISGWQHNVSKLLHASSRMDTTTAEQFLTWLQAIITDDKGCWESVAASTGQTDSSGSLFSYHPIFI